MAQGTRSYARKAYSGIVFWHQAGLFPL